MFMRAKVVETDIDNNRYGAVKVFIPDLMVTKLSGDNEDTTGIIAYPANNPVGGRNNKDSSGESFYQGSVYVPPKGSWVWIFFENNDRNKPYYFAAFDRENATLPPECTSSKVTIIYKSNKGKSIVVSDESGSERIDITGSNSNLGNSPSGSGDSVSKNINIISIDERDGDKIIIQLKNGNRIVLDNDNIGIFASGNLDIKVGGNLNLQATGDVNIKAGGKISEQSGSSINIKSSSALKLQSGAILSLKAGGAVAADGSTSLIQSGASSSAGTADGANPVDGRV